MDTALLDKNVAIVRQQTRILIKTTPVTTHRGDVVVNVQTVIPPFATGAIAATMLGKIGFDRRL